MRFDEIGLPEELVAFTAGKGYTELYPPQEAAVKAGLLEGKSLVVSSPTACYDEVTEVLTRRGWILFKDAMPDEEVVSMNPRTWEIEYVKAIGKVEYLYSGVMIHVAGKEIDFRVTESHRIYCRTGSQNSREAREPSGFMRYHFKPAREIQPTWVFKTDGIWKGKARKYFVLPAATLRGGSLPRSKRELPPLRIPMRDWLDFFGWYVAEGTSKHGVSHEVTLCQTKDQAGVEAAVRNLRHWKVYVTGSKEHRHFSVASVQLAKYLSQFGRAYEKFVPDFIKELSPEQIKVFLDSYQRGDGHVGRDGVSPVFDTTSKRLADDLQELLLKVGRSSSVRNRGLSPSHIMPDGHLIVSKHPHYQVSCRRYSEHGIDYRKPSKPAFERVQGERVYCLTLPKHHLLYVRRNGKALWCGNSGKTMIAIMAAFVNAKVRMKKTVYLAPLRALASEKYSEFSELTKYGVNTAISTGDYDSSGETLGRADIIVLTNERFDSILRHRVSWLRDVGLFIADEVHLAGSDSRGPTLEMILTKMMHMGLNAQLLSLSATISNSKEIGEWLKSETVQVDWRPVPLREGVFDYGRVLFVDGEERQIVRSTYGSPIDVAMETLKAGGQALVFANTRRRAVSLATRAAELTGRHLKEEEKKAAEEAGRRILSSGEETSLSRLLAELVSKGAAFHHAGLESEHRRVVEDYYRAGAIRLLAATPTLASGVNIPARRVVVADMTRYDAESGGNAEISVLEYRQMAGRAGRPQYDSFGETVMIPPPSMDSGELLEHYAKSPPEPIESRLADDSSMRFHTLATIATASGLSKGDLDSLFKGTLLARQVGEATVGKLTEKALGYLLAERLVEGGGGLFYPTDFGRRVSILYIDPATGVVFREGIRKVEPGRDYTAGLLRLLAGSPDFEPKFPLRSKDFDQAVAFIEEHSAEMIERPNSRQFSAYDEVLQEMRTVMALHGWIDEWREEQLLSRLGVEPGDMHRAVDNAEWLLHALGELAKLFKKPEVVRQVDVLRMRVASGVSAELVELTTLQGVGRVRARALYTAGFKTLEDVKEAPAERLAGVEKVGTAVARRIKEQVARY
ncbi:MAG: DEAD/DEAH box helicase [archaeon]|nr:MAG: DEAD/DEAH box helicase [archaeon]